MRVLGVKGTILAIIGLIPLLAGAQRIYIYPTAPVASPGSFQSVTAIVTGSNNKTVTWTTDGGTIVGTNPCVVNEPCTVALYTTSPGTYHLKATSNASNAVTATSTITITPSPTPVTTHPRLYITQSMLSGLQTKFSAGSPMATNLKIGDGSDYGGVTWYNILKAAPYNWSFSCESGTGLPASGVSAGNLENAAYTFALLALVNPNTSAGTNWGCYGHDVWIYAMNHMTSGSFSPSQDEWRGDAAQFIFTTDWLLGSGAISSVGDLTEARTWVAWMLKYTLTNNFSDFLPALTGPYNSSSMLGRINQMRSMGNNYDEAGFFYLAALPLTFNDTTSDDPALTNTCSATRYQVCADGTAGSMHAYFKSYFVGGLLYDQYAIMEDPNVGWQAYQAAYGNLPAQPACVMWDGLPGTTPCFGEQRGGEPAEGSGYGYSAYSIRDGLNAIHTAGYDDPTIYGPQMSLGTSSWWDMRAVVTNEFLTGLKANNGNPGGVGGIQPSYAYLHTGDAKHYYAEPSDYLTESATLVFDSYTGRSDRTNALLWPILNSAFGGPAGTAGGCNQYCGIDNVLGNDYANVLNPDLFIALAAVDPGTLTPADPRPSMPTDLYNGSYNQHLMVRSGFTNADSLLTYYCENSLVNHEHATCGMFEIYANNEWITKGRVTFDADYNFQMSTAPQNNQMSIQNVSSGTPVSTGAWDYSSVSSGGLWQEGTQAGLVSLYHSELPAYSAMIADTTNQYNSLDQTYTYDDVVGASRSMIYLRGTNQVVTYDRAATKSANAKATYMNTTGTPTVSGNTASWPTQSGTQKAYYTSLLPAGGTLSNVGLTAAPENGSDWEVVSTLKVDAGSPASTQSLNVLEWGAASFSKSTTTLVQSTAGQSFDGALVGKSLVLFMHNWPTTFTGTTFPASGASTIYVSDLTPSTTYSITGGGTPSTVTTDTAGVATFSATGTGNITIGTVVAATLQSIAVTAPGGTLSIASTQQYTATCTYSDGTSSTCTSAVTWSSSMPSVASVSSSGLVTGVATGSANIVATGSGLQGQINLSVSAPTLQSIAITPGTSTLAVGSTQQFQAMGIFSDSSTANITSQVTWSSTNASVASTTATGLCVAKSQGTTDITAAQGNILVQAAVTVAVAGTPSFSPAGGSYSSAQSVAITSSTSGATIYYTTNGSTPTTSSAVYSGPVSVAASETLQAIAVASNYSNSPAATATYTIALPAAGTPSFSPAGGSYSSAQLVAITSSTSGATIYYTTNGSTPTTSSTIYSGPISSLLQRPSRPSQSPATTRTALQLRPPTPSPCPPERLRSPRPVEAIARHSRLPSPAPPPAQPSTTPPTGPPQPPARPSTPARSRSPLQRPSRPSQSPATTRTALQLRPPTPSPCPPERLRSPRPVEAIARHSRLPSPAPPPAQPSTTPPTGPPQPPARPSTPARSRSPLQRPSRPSQSPATTPTVRLQQPPTPSLCPPEHPAFPSTFGRDHSPCPPERPEPLR